MPQNVQARRSSSGQFDLTVLFQPTVSRPQLASSAVLIQSLPIPSPSQNRFRYLIFIPPLSGFGLCAPSLSTMCVSDIVAGDPSSLGYLDEGRMKNGHASVVNHQPWIFSIKYQQQWNGR